MSEHTTRGIPPALEQFLADNRRENERRRNARRQREAEAPAAGPRVYPFACCPKAAPLPCVCAFAYSCPEHGDTHIGTHD